MKNTKTKCQNKAAEISKRKTAIVKRVRTANGIERIKRRRRLWLRKRNLSLLHDHRVEIEKIVRRLFILT